MLLKSFTSLGDFISACCLNCTLLSDSEICIWRPDCSAKLYTQVNCLLDRTGLLFPLTNLFKMESAISINPTPKPTKFSNFPIH